ncbi:hypothetical protein [Methylocystis sp.]|uniref:hypothetical protein n=1 Tax=Methylocystis sp. TaxID=1911079 RepID=UPI003DA5F5DD
MRRDAEGMRGRHLQRQEAVQSREAAAGWLFREAPRHGLTVAIAAFLAVLAAPALAAPRSIDDCEAIKEADAYNRCLASFGPTRGQHGATYPGVAAEGGHSGKASGRGASRPASRSGRAELSRGRGGRVRMEFTPGRR